MYDLQAGVSLAHDLEGVFQVLVVVELAHVVDGVAVAVLGSKDEEARLFVGVLQQLTLAALGAFQHRLQGLLLLFADAALLVVLASLLQDQRLVPVLGLHALHVHPQH